MHRESTLRRSGKNEVLEADSEACQNTLFWSTSVLELVESVLMPVKGGPPVLPENGDAVFLCIFCVLMFKGELKWFLSCRIAWIVLYFFLPFCILRLS